MLELPENADDIQVENAPVRQHKFGDWTIEGYSRAAVQSYWRIPELKIGFDLGLQPWSFMTTQTWALTHAHLDHIAALPVYVARRRLMHMPQPVIFLPDENKQDVDALLKIVQRLDRGRLPCTLVGCRPGDEYEISREQLLSCFATRHTVPSLGFTLWDRRKKLKEEFAGKAGEEIRDLRLSGVEVTNEVRTPLVTYMGDTSPAGLDENPAVYRSRVLIMEITFFTPDHRKEKIHKFGHTHLDDIIDRASCFENELIIAGHFSTRYHDDQIRRIVEKRLPDSLKSKLLLWI